MNRLPPIRMVVLLMVGVLLIGGGVTFWANTSSQAAKARYEKLVTEVPDESELNRMVAQSQAKVDDYKTQLQHLEQGVPTLAYVPTLLTELEAMAKQHSIAVTGVRPIVENKFQKNSDDKTSGETKKKTAYEEMSIDISGRGSYGNVMQMIEALKKFPKIIAIQTIGLVPRRESNQNPAAGSATSGIVLDATIRIKAYLFPTPVPGQKAENNGAAS